MKSEYKTTWTKKEFKAYVLLYCSQADFTESNAERGLIVSKVGREDYNHIYEELEKDNDYARVQKIMKTSKRMNYHHDNLIKDMKEVFFADGDYSILEQNLLLTLKKILQ